MAATLRADFIVMNRQMPEVYAMYPRRTSRRELTLLAQRAAAQGGARVNVASAALDDPTAVPTLALVLNLHGADDPDRALRTFRRITKPRLPIAIGLLKIDLLLCRCHTVSSRVTRIQMVRGFAPDDDEAFQYRFASALRPKPLGQLFSRNPRPPYPHVMDAVEQALRQVGAYATELHVNPKPDPRPCQHPK